MEPESTLREVNCILKLGGVFATVDCDWPPVTKWQAEQAYMSAYNRVKQLESDLPDVRDSFVRYPKKKHLANMIESGYFRYCREIVFANEEPCTAERLVGLLMSQGSLQTVLKLHPELLQDDLEKFRRTVRENLGSGEFTVSFCYRMRIAVK